MRLVVRFLGGWISGRWGLRFEVFGGRGKGVEIGMGEKEDGIEEGVEGLLVSWVGWGRAGEGLWDEWELEWRVREERGCLGLG